jgi:hypothetical protein
MFFMSWSYGELVSHTWFIHLGRLNVITMLSTYCRGWPRRWCTGGSRWNSRGMFPAGAGQQMRNFLAVVVAHLTWMSGGVHFVRTQNEQRLEASPRNCRNWIFRFGKSNSPVLSGPMAVRDAIRLWWAAPPPAKWRLDGGEAWTLTTLEVEVAAKRSNWQKKKKTRKLWQKVWKVYVRLIKLMDPNNWLWSMFI